jgi:hypothetical protein
MVVSPSLLSAVLLVFSVGSKAGPATHDPLKLTTNRMLLCGEGKNLIAADRARVQYLVQQANELRGSDVPATPEQRSASSFDVTSSGVRQVHAHHCARLTFLCMYVGYVTSVGIGPPPTWYDLIVDTGSASTWCGAN